MPPEGIHQYCLLDRTDVKVVDFGDNLLGEIKIYSQIANYHRDVETVTLLIPNVIISLQFHRSR